MQLLKEPFEAKYNDLVQIAATSYKVVIDPDMITQSKVNPLIPSFQKPNPLLTSCPPTMPSCMLPSSTLDELVGAGNCQGMSDMQKGSRAKAG